MKYQLIHSKKMISAFCRKNPYLHLYSFGDLDDFFWNYTSWYGKLENDGLSELVLLYQGVNPPSLLAFTENPVKMKELLYEISGFLPPQFYAHLSPGLEDVFEKAYTLESHGKSLKMALTNKDTVLKKEYPGVERLLTHEQQIIRQLYQESYPGNWFDQRMLETNQYFGIKKNGKLVSIAGIHVYSETYRVAALGNITTHPDWRGQGLGKAVTGRLCQSLLEYTDHIGLNVNAENRPAIRCYEQLGFEIVATYHEFMLRLK